MVVDHGLQARARAAREAITAGGLDPLLALSFVICPTEEFEAAVTARGARGQTRTYSAQTYSAETRARALELIDAGMSWSAVGREIGAAKATVGAWVRQSRVAA